MREKDKTEEAPKIANRENQGRKGKEKTPTKEKSKNE